jgi:hypothetical protein
MAQYFSTKEEAVARIKELQPKYGKPAFFGKILNNNFGTEQWLVDYDVRDYGTAFTVIENLTHEPAVNNVPPLKATTESSSNAKPGAPGERLPAQHNEEKRWWQFWKRDQPTTESNSKHQVVKQNSPTKGNNWYLACDKSRGLRQVVLLSDPNCKTASRFGTFFFASTYSDLVNNSIVTGFFRLDGDPGPYLMIRTDGTRDDGYEAVDEMAKDKFRIAFNFGYMPTSGVISIFVCSSFLNKYSKNGFMEMHYGLDFDNTRNLLSDAFQRDELQVVHARGGGGGALPNAKYDIAIPIDGACKQVLVDEWKSLLTHHTKIAQPNYQTAVNRLFQMFPPGTSDPIMSNPNS